MYIVTGGAGFIGSAMLWKLNSLGIDDIVVVDNLGCSEKWKNLVNRRYAMYLHRDEFLQQVLGDCLPGGVEAIIHLGACSATTERDADFLMRNNLEYSKTLCLYAELKNIRFINASSAATYGGGEAGFDDDQEALYQLKPLNMYGYSKHLFDLWAHKRALQGQGLASMASVKFFNVYGPNEEHKGEMRSVVNKAFHAIRQSGRMRLFRSTSPDYADGGQMRDFVYVKDCVDALWWLVCHPEANGIFNLGSGRARTWNDLVKAVFKAMDLPETIEYVDMPAELKGKYQNFTQAAMSRLALAGFRQPMHSLEEGVNDYVRNYLLNADSTLEQNYQAARPA